MTSVASAAVRRAVVTGASSGIGAATVRRLRADGWAVLGVARRGDRLEALKAETGAEVLVVDVTKAGSVAALADFVAGWGPVQALVNNAGGALGSERVEDADFDEWRMMLDSNVIGVGRVTKALLPALRAGIMPGESVAIVTVSSVAASSPYEGGAGYNAAKAGAHMVAAVLRLELAGEPIKVIEVLPGMVHTEEFSLTRYHGDQAKADAVYADIDRPLTADDIAETIVHAIELPAHVAVESVTVRPLAQASQHKVVRGPIFTR